MIPRIKDLVIIQKKPPECMLLWDFRRKSSNRQFMFDDSENDSDYFGLAGETTGTSGDYDTPGNANLFIFRKNGGPITEEDIYDYFLGRVGNSLVEIKRLKPDVKGVLPRRYSDRERIFKTNTYYFAIVIQDADTGFISEMTSNSITIN